MSRLSFETPIAAPPERCLDVALTVETHLEYPGSKESAVGGVTSGRMGHNDVVTWESRRFGLPVRMTSKITELDRPHRFVDEMQRGPFKSWRHVHRFESTNYGTLMTDEIEYRVPFGPLGTLVNALFIRPYMMRLARHLTAYIRACAERLTIEGGN